MKGYFKVSEHVDEQGRKYVEEILKVTYFFPSL